MNATSKAYVIHKGWLGEEKVEVTVLSCMGDKCIVQAVEGHPFDMHNESRQIPYNAKVRFSHDTYWYDKKIVPLSAVQVESQ